MRLRTAIHACANKINCKYSYTTYTTKNFIFSRAFAKHTRTRTRTLTRTLTRTHAHTHTRIFVQLFVNYLHFGDGLHINVLLHNQKPYLFSFCWVATSTMVATDITVFSESPSPWSIYIICIFICTDYCWPMG